MTGQKQPSQAKRKVKTGCATCRIRKIKCDEAKPFCQKCVKTGRKCDGYESIFRPFLNQPTSNETNTGNSIHSSAHAAAKAPLDVASLNRYFSTKTIFDVKLSCSQEAQQVLQASLTDPSIRHALLSLRALRENLESIKDSDSSESTEQQTLSYNYGLQQYSKALTSLASNLSSPSPDGLKSALLCCQVLISVEQVRSNFAAMSLHIIRGLNIMREYKARPYLTANGLMPARHSGLPFLDVFIIKMFAAPCKFTEQKEAETASTMTPPTEAGNDRKLAPNMRTELTKMATSTIELLAGVTRVESAEKALGLLAERDTLLGTLDSWLGDLETLQKETHSGEPEPIADIFLRILFLILRIVLLGTLKTSPEIEAQLRTENEQLQNVASDVNERLKHYDMRRGIGNALANESSIR
ncbi:Transcriptional regulatory protein moc3 [Fusarium austroafricanum]|uniref:Transcriptional regulatory protein moc3 n=1 Tax=Fusarium austroafricanum TaxID=2364996 RepID=A0A8H4KSC2_9HYPO|nr:Transcriptional regulatory protein moc3 [Fusarium austroafricanum]